jgi:hypothetical protein
LQSPGVNEVASVRVVGWFYECDVPIVGCGNGNDGSGFEHISQRRVVIRVNPLIPSISGWHL